MNVHDFIATRPCLEEIDGYIEGIRNQMETAGETVPVSSEIRWKVKKVWGVDMPRQITLKPPAETMAEILAPIETYRKRLITGKEIPAPSKLERAYTYTQGRKPKR